MEELNNEYMINQQKLLTSINNYQIIFQVTKCCDYYEWVTVFKKQTTTDLYKNVGFQFYNTPLNLYGIHKDTNEKIIIPNDDTNIKDFIIQNRDFFIPIYPVPYQIVYRIYYDDGKCHTHST